MPTMNIKDPRVRALAHELAELRHTSATGAVRQALEEALAAEVRRRAGTGARLAALQQRVAATSAQWLDAQDLYDADGLPR